MQIILAMCWVAFILWVSFGTTAVYEYLRLFTFMEKITHIKEYESFRQHDITLKYTDFVNAKYPSFFIRLFSCPFCLGVWYSAIFCFMFGCLYLLPIVYGGSCFLFLLCRWMIRRL